MKATKTPHEQGQSLWLDNIIRSMLDGGTIRRYIDDERLSCERFDEPHCGCTSIINGSVTQGDSEP